MDNWLGLLKFDPLPPLLAAPDDALRYFARHDLLEEDLGPIEQLWSLPEAIRILRKQQPDGRWRRSGVNRHPAINPDLIETWRYFRILVEQYGFHRAHPAINRAAEYLFACQAPRGDFRGMLANQYATYYTGAILASLVQAGYEVDARVEKAFHWLLDMRQADGGWTIPMLTHRLDRALQYRLTTEYMEPLDPDRSKPSSHHWTGMVLRAFAAHPTWRRSPQAQAAACLLKSRFFQPDVYTSYQSAAYWVRFEVPFWWTNLVTALDSLFKMGFTARDENIRCAVEWLGDHQEPSGLWKVSYMEPEEKEKTTSRVRSQKLWVTLAICRVLKGLAVVNSAE